MCHHPVVMGIIFTSVVILLAIVLTVTGYIFIHKPDTIEKGFPVVSHQSDHDTVINDSNNS